MTGAETTRGRGDSALILYPFHLKYIGSYQATVEDTEGLKGRDRKKESKWDLFDSFFLFPVPVQNVMMHLW